MEKVHSLPGSEVKDFLKSFLDMRAMVVGCLREIPEGKLDYAPSQMAGTHTLRDCIAELPIVEQGLIDGIETGRRRMFSNDMFEGKKPTKEEILNILKETDEALFDAITSSTFDSEKKIEFLGKDGQVKWKTTAIMMLWGLRNHENMHLGMIRRDLDAIGVNPPAEYVKYWYLE